MREKLFPLLEQDTALELTDKLRTLAQVLEIVRMEEFVPEPQRGKRGGQEIDRRPLARAFLAKAFLNLHQTRALKEHLRQSDALRHLCGMDKVPSEATFSRAFAQFSTQNLGTLVHDALVKKFVSSQLVMHVSHDSTAVEAREKALRKLNSSKTPAVKKSVVVRPREKFALRQSLRGYKSRLLCQPSKLWQNCPARVIGVSSGTRMATSTAGVVTKRILPGPMG